MIPSLGSLITQRHKPMPLLDKKQVVWCYMYTVILPTLVNQNYEAEYFESTNGCKNGITSLSY